jgi:SEC-C motif/Antitoxin Xre/MbcA/ParS C-terminal toxin-binding domain
MANIGRNAPCPCGSGKKYKKCCLPATFQEIAKEESIEKKLVDNLIHFIGKHYRHVIDDARSVFWDDFAPEDHLDQVGLDLADMNFWEWLIFDYMVEDEHDKTIVELYMEHNKKLSLDEHKVLTMMKNSVISLYEVQEVMPEKGILLKDLLLGGEYDVREKMATRSLKRWDIFAARLLHVDNKYVMSGCVYPYVIQEKESILADINRNYEDYRQDYLDAAMDEFLKHNSEDFNFYWYELIQNTTPLALHTSSGEPLIFAEAIFDLHDKDAVLAGLPKIEGIELEGDNFVWFDKRDKEGNATVLGWISIHDNQLILRCNSQKRCETGKAMILARLSGFLSHVRDKYQDPMEAIKSHADEPKEQSAGKLPLEVEQELYTEFIKRHYEKWLNDHIPALGGMTPVQAIMTKEGRERVKDLLKSIENIEEGHKKAGRPHCEMSWLWERLGLKKE